MGTRMDDLLSPDAIERIKQALGNRDRWTPKRLHDSVVAATSGQPAAPSDGGNGPGVEG